MFRGEDAFKARQVVVLSFCAVAIVLFAVSILLGGWGLLITTSFLHAPFSQS